MPEKGTLFAFNFKKAISDEEKGHQEADDFSNELHGLSNSNLDVEESRGVTVEQLFRGLIRPSRLSRAREMHQISLPVDMFSSESEPEPDSGDEEYHADSRAFARAANPDAEVEESAADEIQEGVDLVD